MQYSPGAHLANSRLTIAETGKIKATARQRRMGEGGRWRKRAWADKEQSRAAHKGGVKRGEGERGASLVWCLSICKLHNNSPPVAAAVAATAKLQVSRCNVLPKLWVVGRGGVAVGQRRERKVATHKAKTRSSFKSAMEKYQCERQLEHDKESFKEVFYGEPVQIVLWTGSDRILICH